MISGSDTSSSFYRMTLIFYPSSTLTSEDVLAANSSSSYRLGSTVSFRELVSDFEPRVRKLAELVQPEDCFLWKIAHLPKLKTWANGSGRVVLLGDAAHAMVPHLGAVSFSSPPAVLITSRLILMSPRFELYCCQACSQENRARHQPSRTAPSSPSVSPTRIYTPHPPYLLLSEPTRVSVAQEQSVSKPLLSSQANTRSCPTDQLNRKETRRWHKEWTRRTQNMSIGKLVED